jgi:hypothetical protein
MFPVFPSFFVEINPCPATECAKSGYIFFFAVHQLQAVLPIRSLWVTFHASQPVIADLNQNLPPSPDSTMIVLDIIMIELITDSISEPGCSKFRRIQNTT